MLHGHACRGPLRIKAILQHTSINPMVRVAFLPIASHTLAQ
jgi:hypothetical protein